MCFSEGEPPKTPFPSKMASGGDPAFDAVSVCSAPVTQASERGRMVLSAVHSESDLCLNLADALGYRGSNFLVVKESC